MNYFEHNQRAQGWPLVPWPDPIEVSETWDEAAVAAAEREWLERVRREQNQTPRAQERQDSERRGKAIPQRPL